MEWYRFCDGAAHCWALLSQVATSCFYEVLLIIPQNNPSGVGRLSSAKSREHSATPTFYINGM